MNQENNKPYIVSSLMNEEKRYYYQKYINGEIRLEDIPLKGLSGKVLTYAVEKDPKNLIEFLLNLSEERKISIDLLKYLKMVPILTVKDEYYYRYFKLDPVKNYKKMPVVRRTMQMALDLMEMDPNNIEIIWEKHKSKEICDKAFSYDMNLIRFIPSEHITKEMSEKTIKYNSLLLQYIPFEYRTREMFEYYIKDCASRVRVSISKAINERDWGSNSMYLNFLVIVPREYLTQKIFDEMFELNPLLFVAFPDKFKTTLMCNKIFEIYGDRMIYFIPKRFLYEVTHKTSLKDKTFKEKEDVYYENFKDDPLDRIDYIPLEYRTQRVYDLLFKTGGMYVIDKIPFENRTQEMWDRVVFNARDISVLKDVPEHFITREMCEYLYNLFSTRTEELCFIPSKYLSKEMCIDLLNDNIYENLTRLSLDKLDEEVLSIIVVKLKKMISEGKTLGANRELVKYIVGLYPYLIKAFNKDIVKEIIIEELYSLIVNEGTVENIANKYGISISYIKGVLEDIRDTDVKAYDMIKNILDMNQNKWFYNMQKDVSNLDIIISMLGNIKDNKLDMGQKVKFAYLYIRYIGNSLEEIYNFNYNKYTDKDYRLVDNFFKRVLKYNYIFGVGKDITTVPETKTIEFNNSWLRKYDRNRFFSIKDGNATMERRYGKDSKLLTLDIEKEIINELRISNIPLNDMIVQGAFREYFNGRLNDYIKQFIGYDMEFENKRKERGR